MSVRRSMLTAVVAVTLLFGAVAAHQMFDVASVPPAIPGLSVAAPVGGLSCSAVAPVRLNGNVWSREKELLLASNDVVRFVACAGGELHLVARGSSAAGVGAYMVVSGPAGNLWEGEVADAVDVALAVPSTGWVGVAFLNDKVQAPEDRNLWLEKLEFRPAGGS